MMQEWVSWDLCEGIYITPNSWELRIIHWLSCDVVEAHSCVELIPIVNWWATTQLLIILTSRTIWPRSLCQLLTRWGVLWETTTYIVEWTLYWPYDSYFCPIKWKYPKMLSTSVECMQWSLCNDTIRACNCPQWGTITPNVPPVVREGRMCSHLKAHQLCNDTIRACNCPEYPAVLCCHWEPVKWVTKYIGNYVMLDLSIHPRYIIYIYIYIYVCMYVYCRGGRWLLWNCCLKR